MYYFALALKGDFRLFFRWYDRVAASGAEGSSNGLQPTEGIRQGVSRLACAFTLHKISVSMNRRDRA